VTEATVPRVRIKLSRNGGHISGISWFDIDTIYVAIGGLVTIAPFLVLGMAYTRQLWAIVGSCLVIGVLLLGAVTKGRSYRIVVTGEELVCQGVLWTKRYCRSEQPHFMISQSREQGIDAESSVPTLACEWGHDTRQGHFDRIANATHLLKIPNMQENQAVVIEFVEHLNRVALEARHSRLRLADRAG
jgi:hypothetical protein